MNKNRLDIGITNTSYGSHPYTEALDKISAHGYGFIDFQGFVNIESQSFRLDIPEFTEWLLGYRRDASMRGVGIWQAHAPWRYPARDASAEERILWIEAMKKAIYGAHVLGCMLFVVHPLMPYMDSSEGKDEVISLNRVFFSELLDTAKEFDITVCIENLPFTEYPLSTVEAVCRFVDEMERDNFKVCLDTGHAAIFSPDVASAVRYIGTRLAALHIHDNMGDTDAHLQPGDGIIDWDAFAEALREIGFSGVISLETSAKCHFYPECEWEERERHLADIAREIAAKAYREK